MNRELYKFLKQMLNIDIFKDDMNLVTKDMSNVFISTVWNNTVKQLRDTDILVFCVNSY